MKKLLSVMIIAMLGSSTCLASTSLNIHLTDGTEIVCNLDKEPQMTFGEKTITLTSLDGSVGEWNFANVDNWSFSEIDAIKQVEENSLIKIEDGKLTLTGAATKSVAVYDIGGKIVIPVQSTSGSTTINLNGLAKGTYILKTDKASAKFMIK